MFAAGWRRKEGDGGPSASMRVAGLVAVGGWPWADCGGWVAGWSIAAVGGGPGDRSRRLAGGLGSLTGTGGRPGPVAAGGGRPGKEDATLYCLTVD